MIRDDETIRIGTVTRTHGNRGEVQCLTCNGLWEEADAEFLVLRLDGIQVPFRVTDWRSKGADTLLFTLDGIDSEQKAQALAGAEALMLRRDVATDDGGEADMTAWQDLTGWHLYTAGGGCAGVIRRVDESTANILAETDKGRLLPLHEDLIVRFDTVKKELQLSLPDDI